jgi:hypothetical protein
MRNLTKLGIAFVAAAGLVLTATPSYAADADPTSVTITGSFGSIAADGFLLNGQSAPTTDPYPAQVPQGYSGFEAVSSLFVGTIDGSDDELLFYCLQVLKGHGQAYASVAQGDANVDNGGYAARIIHDYYPATSLPDSGLADNNERATAVQSAIWYFTDGFVLAPDSRLHDAVAGIVADALAQGPLPDSVPDPDLSFSLNGPAGPFAAGTLAGPFTAAAALRIERYTIDAGGATMYGDASGTTVIPPNTAISPDQGVWVKADGAATIDLTAHARVDGADGRLFMGANPDLDQTLIAAAQRYPLTATARAEFVVTPPTTPPATPTAAPELANTGSDSSAAGPLVGFAALIVMAGAAALIAVETSRRRRASARRLK